MLSNSSFGQLGGMELAVPCLMCDFDGMVHPGGPNPPTLWADIGAVGNLGIGFIDNETAE